MLTHLCLIVPCDHELVFSAKAILTLPLSLQVRDDCLRGYPRSGLARARFGEWGPLPCSSADACCLAAAAARLWEPGRCAAAVQSHAAALPPQSLSPSPRLFSFCPNKRDDRISTRPSSHLFHRGASRVSVSRGFLTGSFRATDMTTGMV